MTSSSIKVYSSELSLKNKIARAIWGIAYLLLFRITPRPMHGWRRFVLRVFRAKVGHQVKVYPSARIWAPWNLEIKDAAILGDRVDCYCVSRIVIGTKAVISQDSCLCAATHEHENEDFKLVYKSIQIGDNAWIAARAFVGPGVTIGKNATLGACAVSFKNIADNMTMVGNPAQPVATAKLMPHKEEQNVDAVSVAPTVATHDDTKNEQAPTRLLA